MKKRAYIFAVCIAVIMSMAVRVMTFADTGSAEIGTLNGDDSVKVQVVTDGEDKDLYYIEDTEKHIKIFNLKKTDSDTLGSDRAAYKEIFENNRVTSSGDTVFGNTDDEKKQDPETAFYFINNICDIRSYFVSSFGYPAENEDYYLFYNDGHDKGKNSSATRGPGASFIYIGHKMNGRETQIIAHEFTHTVTRSFNAAVSDNYQSQVIREGLADVFAFFYTDNWDFVTSRGDHRNAADPGKYHYPAHVNDDLDGCPEQDCHARATLISHAAYLMAQSGWFNEDKMELEKLWYETVKILPENCSYVNLRSCMEYVADIHSLSGEQKDAVGKAFDEVGISYMVPQAYSNDIEVTVYDRQGNIYDDYTVEISQRGFNSSLGIEQYSLVNRITGNGSGKVRIHLEDGDYVIRIRDNSENETCEFYMLSVASKNTQKSLEARDFGPEAEYVLENTRKIRTAADLNAVRYAPDGDYELAANIDISGINWEPIGSTLSPFTGEFNGNGYTITGLKINADKSSDFHGGLFGVIDHGKVMNVKLADVNVRVKVTNDERLFSFAGGVAGQLIGAEVSGCSVTGTIKSEGRKEAFARAGGIAAESTDQTVITDCYVSASVLSDADGANSMAGGISGWLGDSRAENCLVYGTVSASDTRSYVFAGGISGSGGNAVIKHCVVLADMINGSGVEGAEHKVSPVNAFATIENCIAADDISGDHTGSDSITFMPRKNVFDTDTFKQFGWDFDNIWLLARDEAVLR